MVDLGLLCWPFTKKGIALHPPRQEAKHQTTITELRNPACLKVISTQMLYFWF